MAAHSSRQGAIPTAAYFQYAARLRSKAAVQGATEIEASCIPAFSLAAASA